MKGMGIEIKSKLRFSTVLATVAVLVSSCGGRAAAPSTAPIPSPAPPSYELWVVDQGDTTPAGGGTLYIYKGASLGDAAPAPAYTVNLGEAALGVGDGVGKHGHSIAFNPAMTHAVISFVDSGHVQVIRASDRKVVASIKMTGSAAGAAQPHATAVTPAGDAIIVANQGGKRLQRIAADFKNDVYKLDSAADLDLSVLEDADHPGNLPRRLPGDTHEGGRDTRQIRDRTSVVLRHVREGHDLDDGAGRRNGDHDELQSVSGHGPAR